jgi:hypothetical protein
MFLQPATRIPAATAPAGTAALLPSLLQRRFYAFHRPNNAPNGRAWRRRSDIVDGAFCPPAVHFSTIAVYL